jgi:hypothetical protein
LKPLGSISRTRVAWLGGGIAVVAIAVIGTLRPPAAPPPSADPPSPTQRATGFPAEQIRAFLFDILQPVTLSNCEFQRFGEARDGGYLLCGNLLGDVRAGYSYGISGYDGWGCQVASTLEVPVHQYDCFDTRQPACEAPTTFHAECVGAERRVVDGRVFDTVEQQLAGNGHGAVQVVMKMDVEGAEWDVFLQARDEVLERIDQLAVEFHRADEMRFINAVQRLKRFFHVANLHMNNHACEPGHEPFPAWAYEVLFVSKRLGVVDPAAPPRALFHSLDTPNTLIVPDCQATPLGRDRPTP